MNVSVRSVVARDSVSALKNVWPDDPFVMRARNFAEMTPADLRSLRAVIETETTVKKRRDLVLDGYECSKLYFVKDGFAARYKLLRSGKRQIVNFVLPGDIVGIPGSFLDRAVSSVVAVSDMILQVCLLEAFVDLCCRRPKFGLLLSWLAMHEAANYAEHIIDVGRRTPTERLAHLLLEIHSRLAMVGLAEGSAFNLPFTQEMMSDALGLSVPHLNRTLAQLRADELVAVDGRRIEILDRKTLQLTAQFQPIQPARIPFNDLAVKTDFSSAAVARTVAAARS